MDIVNKCHENLHNEVTLMTNTIRDMEQAKDKIKNAIMVYFGMHIKDIEEQIDKMIWYDSQRKIKGIIEYKPLYENGIITVKCDCVSDSIFTIEMIMKIIYPKVFLRELIAK